MLFTFRIMGGTQSESSLNPIEVKVLPFQQTAQPEEFNVGIFSAATLMGMIFVLVPVSLAVDMVNDREVSTDLFEKHEEIRR